MKQLLAALTIIALSYSAASFAEQPPAPMAGMQHEGMQSGMQHGGGGMAMDEQHVQLMQEHILKMHELSTQILAEKDPAKKEQLKQQQRDVMKAHHAGMMGGHGGMK
jgi:opacity protein-like surface antigen